jgi:hypothetical protein
LHYHLGEFIAIIGDQLVKCNSIGIKLDIYESRGQSGMAGLAAGPVAAADAACCGQAAAG